MGVSFKIFLLSWCVVVSIFQGSALKTSKSVKAILRSNSNRDQMRPTILATSSKELAATADKSDPKTSFLSKIKLNALELCICGAVATIVGDFVMHPIDTIKVTQQTASVAKGMLATTKDIILNKGPFALYQGVIPYLIGDGISGAVKFATYELSKRFTENKLPEKWHGWSQFICAAFAMLSCSVVLVPAEVLKTRLQAGAATSMLGAISSTLRNEGFLGLYAGYYATLVRDVPYTMLELGLYENLKIMINKAKLQKQCSSSDELLAAAVTGGITALLTTPLDLVKTKLMVQSGSSVAYLGVADALRSIYEKGGMPALFVGAFARVAWLLPFTTIYLGVYEAIKRAFVAHKQRKQNDYSKHD